MRSFFLVSPALVASLFMSGEVLAGSVANQVINYTPGTASAAFRNSAAALGLPNGDTGYGALTPFNPAFSASDIVIVGGGGSLTVKLDSAVGISSAARLGVFDNTGIADESPSTFDADYNYTSGGTGQAGAPPFTFGGGAGYVSVSSDGLTWYAKTAAGWQPAISAAPQLTTFSAVTNGYTDNTINLGQGSIGQSPSDYFAPTSVTVDDLAGLSYRDSAAPSDILRVLNGSAGGTWLDLSGVPTGSVQYVKFDAPVGSRVVVDAVTAVPEPAALAAIGVATLLLRRRR